MLKDMHAECMRLSGEIGLLTCTFDLESKCWVIERTDTGKRYSLSPNAYFICGIEYARMIERIIRALYSKEIANMSIVNSLIIKKEKKQMKKDSVADIEYKNAVDSLQNEAWEKKKAIDDDVKIELAELEKKLELKTMKEQVDAWAEEVYARYEALHNKGFAEDLAIELLKIYISKN